MATSNWIKYEQGNGYDKYFEYWKLEDSGTTYFRRTTKDEYRDKIPAELEHQPLSILEQFFKNSFPAPTTNKS